MNVNEWTQRTDCEHEERLELGLPIEEEEPGTKPDIHPLFLKILAEHFLNIEDGKIKNMEVITK